MLWKSYCVGVKTVWIAILWRPVDTGQGQLDLRQWWYDHLGGQLRAAWVAEAIALSERGTRGGENSIAGFPPLVVFF